MLPYKFSSNLLFVINSCNLLFKWLKILFGIFFSTLKSFNLPKREKIIKNGCMLLLLNTFLGYFYGLSNDLNDMAYLMLKEASFLYLDKYLIQFDESVWMFFSIHNWLSLWIKSVILLSYHNKLVFFLNKVNGCLCLKLKS